MAVLDYVKRNGSDTATGKLPEDVEDRLNRGGERLRQIAPKRNECWEFFRGHQTAYLDEDNKLQFQATTTTVRGAGKPRHRHRRSFNLIMDVIQHEVSNCTQRIPSYQVVPSTDDPEDQGAAKLAQKVALYGHDEWGLRHVMAKAVTAALVSDEAFIWPYWDSNIGPFMAEDDDDEKIIGQGDVSHHVFSGNQVGWEPGSRFEDSLWHFVEYAAPMEEVQRREGFFGKPLKPDADTEHHAQKGRDSASQTKMVLVREYLEQPCPKYPNGRWIVTANKRRIVPDRDYPCAEYEGFDGPALHKLTYIIDPDSDRDLGLVRFLLDPQRVFNYAKNKTTEWVQLGMVPQIFVTPGLMQRQKFTDEPGLVIEIPSPEQNVKWREVKPPPQELFQVAEAAATDIGRLAAQNDVPSQVEAGRAIQALIERDQGRRQAFTAQLAEVYSKVMRHDLVLVSKHYTEDRLLKIKGRFGWEREADFRGSQLRSQVDVRVFPDSIEPRTKQAMQDKIFGYADRGWISPQAAMHAIETGTAEDTIDDVMLDVQRANEIIQRVKQGPEVLFNLPQQVVGIEPQMIPDPNGIPDPLTGQSPEVPNPNAGAPIMAPSWMPRKSDNINVWKSLIEAWMKTEDYYHLDVPMQTAVNEIYTKILELDAEKRAEEAAQQSMMAEQQGEQNAAKPQGPKALPDKTSVSEQAKEQRPPTPNQPADQSRPQNF